MAIADVRFDAVPVDALLAADGDAVGAVGTVVVALAADLNWTPFWDHLKGDIPDNQTKDTHHRYIFGV